MSEPAPRPVRAAGREEVVLRRKVVVDGQPLDAGASDIVALSARYGLEQDMASLFRLVSEHRVHFPGVG